MSSVCCPPGSLGAAPLSEKEPKGRMIELSSDPSSSSSRPPLPAYIVGQEDEPSLVVLVYSDVYGIDSGNHKVFCDALLEKLDSTTDEATRTLVVMPDLFRGCAIVGGWNLGWLVTTLFTFPSIIWDLKTRMAPDKIELDIQTIVEHYVKSKLMSKDTQMACVGFCFGGWLVGRHLALNDFCQAGVGIHPGWKVETVNWSSPKALATRVGTRPILLLSARNDYETKPNSPAVLQLAQQRQVEPSQVAVEFPDMRHGWVTRGDSSKDQDVARDQEKALELTVRFILEHTTQQ